MTHSGIWAMGYYTEQELPFYYGLFDDSTLCGNMFCSLLGPTWPNRFYLMAGTSGGITTNGLWGYGIFDYPMILDLLDAAGVSWKVYNVGWDSVPFGNTDNVAVFWENFAHDNRTRGNRGGFLNDLRKDRLPQVSFIIPSFARGWDEHPPASVAVGMGIQEELVSALRAVASVGQLRLHRHLRRARRVLRPRAAAAGRCVRARNPHPDVDHLAVGQARPHRADRASDLTSILKFIERVFGLPTLASVNHRFDTATPTGGDYQAGGAPAPPRDAREDISDMLDCFDF